MKFVRFRLKDKVSYGIQEEDIVREITGSIFGDFQVKPEKFSLGEVSLLAPVEPSKVLCVGLNFRDHIAELGDPTPQVPSHFLKSPTSLIGPGDPVVFPRIARRVDYEGELAADGFLTSFDRPLLPPARRFGADRFLFSPRLGRRR